MSNSLSFLSFCQGDVKGYLRSCRAADSATPDPLILQRMACEIASGLLYLHKHNYIHRWGDRNSIPLAPFCSSPICGFQPLPTGLSLQQYPGAAWVPLKDSSISDFVAGGEPFDQLKHVKHLKWCEMIIHAFLMCHYSTTTMHNVCMSIFGIAFFFASSETSLLETVYSVQRWRWRLETMASPIAGTR